MTREVNERDHNFCNALILGLLGLNTGLSFSVIIFFIVLFMHQPFFVVTAILYCIVQNIIE